MSEIQLARVKKYHRILGTVNKEVKNTNLSHKDKLDIREGHTLTALTKLKSKSQSTYM